MKELLFLVAVVSSLSISSAMRAFPIESREMAERLFQRINPRITWDESNYLVDVSGRYAHCKYLHDDGVFTVDPKFERDGQSLGGLRDTYPGDEAHWAAVMTYIENSLQSWITDAPYRQQIERAELFGCSVQPGCRDGGARSRQVSIACVFSPAYYQADEPVVPTALAFTDDQYILAEIILEVPWDKSHYLENLSGTETDCSMIGQTTYPFPEAEAVENESLNTIIIDGIFGTSPNLGNTENAMIRILDELAKGQAYKLHGVPNLKVGCSLIPDCMYSGQMYVVISCLYSESDLD